LVKLAADNIRMARIAGMALIPQIAGLVLTLASTLWPLGRPPEPCSSPDRWQQMRDLDRAKQRACTRMIVRSTHKVLFRDRLLKHRLKTTRAHAEGHFMCGPRSAIQRVERRESGA
jgi:hypothetical protein